MDKRIEDALQALLQGETVQVRDDAPPVRAAYKPSKGEPRIIVRISEIETAVFGDRSDPEKTYGRRKNRRARFVKETGEWKSVDMEDEPVNSRLTYADDHDTAGSLTDESLDDQVGGVSINDHVRLPQTQSDVNFSIGGERGWAEKIEETPEMLEKRREGQKRAEEKELVKQVARRAVVFGLLVDSAEMGKKTSAGGKKGGKRGKGEQSEDPRSELGGQSRRKCEALMNAQVIEPSFAKGDWAVRWREE